jgi:hypothetical protein
MAIGAKKFYEDKHLNIPDDKLLQTENMSYINELDSVQRFLELEAIHADKTTEGIFAPWCMYKKDYLAVGGHD